MFPRTLSLTLLSCFLTFVHGVPRDNDYLFINQALFYSIYFEYININIINKNKKAFLFNILGDGRIKQKLGFWREEMGQGMDV